MESPPEAPLLEERYSYEINDGVAEPVPPDMAWKCAALGRNTKEKVSMSLIKGTSWEHCDESKIIWDTIYLQFMRTLYVATDPY